MRTRRSVVMALASLALGMAGCAGGSDGVATRTAPTAAEVREGTPVPKAEVKDVLRLLQKDIYADVAFKGAVDVRGLSAVAVTLDDDSTDPVSKLAYFDPTILIGDPGQKLTLVLTNRGNVYHTFTLDEQGIDVELQPGQTRQVTVTFPSGDEPVLPGGESASPFRCDPHGLGGMLGALVAAT